MKPGPGVLAQIVKACAAHRTFCVVGHIRPDGDCIGSQLAVALALRDQGREVVCWNEDPVPQKLAFLDREGLFGRPRRGRAFDCVIATDCASFERLGRAGACVARRRVLINIDHHHSNTRYGDLNWISSRSPSTGELIFRLLKAAAWPLTPPIADCLFTAVSTDTGSFQYATTRPATFRIAGELLRRGANLARICNEVYQSFSLPRVGLLKHVYRSFRLLHGNRIAYCWLRPTDYARTGAQPDDSEGLIDHLRAIESVVVACVFEQLEPDLTRISLRSNRAGVNVNDIAARFGGGGHHAAAGARIRGRPLGVQRRVLASIRQTLSHTS